MDKLVIGDSESVKSRDKGRMEFEELERKRILKELKDKVEYPKCQYEDPNCTGPKVVDAYDDHVVWECSTPDCPCCGEYQGENEFKTDLSGKVLA